MAPDRVAGRLCKLCQPPSAAAMESAGRGQDVQIISASCDQLVVKMASQPLPTLQLCFKPRGTWRLGCRR